MIWPVMRSRKISRHPSSPKAMPINISVTEPEPAYSRGRSGAKAKATSMAVAPIPHIVRLLESSHLGYLRFTKASMGENKIGEVRMAKEMASNRNPNKGRNTANRGINAKANKPRASNRGAQARNPDVSDSPCSGFSLTSSWFPLRPSKSR